MSRSGEQQFIDPFFVDTWIETFFASYRSYHRVKRHRSKKAGCELDVFVSSWCDPPVRRISNRPRWWRTFKEVSGIVQRREMIGKLFLTFWILRWISFFGKRYFKSNEIYINIYKWATNYKLMLILNIYVIVTFR